MAYKLITMYELITIYISLFMVERYVFLEQGLEKKKQRLFYAVTFSLMLVSYFIFDDGIALYITMTAAGLNISLVRKKHRIRGFFLSFPMTGIINGIMVPILVIPVNMQGMAEYQAYVYCFIVYTVVSCLMLLFWIKGKKWRAKFQEELEYRHIHAWEKILLCAVGMLMMFFSNVISTKPTADIDSELLVMQLTLNVYTMGIIAFFLTITIII